MTTKETGGSELDMSVDEGEGVLMMRKERAD